MGVTTIALQKQKKKEIFFLGLSLWCSLIMRFHIGHWMLQITINALQLNLYYKTHKEDDGLESELNSTKSFPSFSFLLHFLVMDLETKLTSQNYDLQEIEMKSNMKDLELPNFGVPNSSSSQGNTNFLQELLHIDPFQPSGSSQNPIFGVQNPNFQTPFEYFTYGCSSADFDGYESKPFVGNNVVKGQSKVMDNFQYGGSDNYSNTLNLPQRNINHHQIMEMMDSNQSQYYVPFDPQETKPVMNFVVPDDEVSCISPDHSFCRRVGLNSKNNRTSSPTTRTCKVRNKSNVVKGQWTVEEDRYMKKFHVDNVILLIS